MILVRLEASPLPLLDPARLELEHQVTDLTTSVIARAPRHVVLVDDDAQGDRDTIVSNCSPSPRRASRLSSENVP